MHLVIYSRPFVIYLLVSGLVGLTLTYWLDDTSNVKINTTIRVGLNILGLLLVYSGISDERWAVGAVVLLVASPVLLTIIRCGVYQDEPQPIPASAVYDPPMMACNL